VLVDINVVGLVQGGVDGDGNNILSSRTVYGATHRNNRPRNFFRREFLFLKKKFEEFLLEKWLE
jgi:hypothetical protein